MLRIISHIEQLLIIHDCVIIPEIGGFVLQAVSAQKHTDEDTFSPMRKELAFNPSLLYSDGLLVNSYMQVYKVDYSQAKAMLDSDVDDLKASLSKYNKVILGTVGSFTTGEAGQIVFHPGKTNLFNASCYGLASLQMAKLPPITVIDRDTDQRNTILPEEAVYYIPISRKLMHSAMAVAATVALFFLISTPVKDVSLSAYTAGIIPTERSIHTASSATTPTISMEEAEIETIITKEVAEPVIETTATSSERKKMYYIIIGSFPSAEQANQFISGVDANEFQQVNTVIRGGKHRVYANVYDTRQEAEAYLTVVRENDKYQSAWLFITR